MNHHNIQRLLAAGALVALTGQANASIATVWQATDTNVNVAGVQLYCPSSSCVSLGVPPSGIEYALFVPPGGGALDTAHYLPVNGGGDQITFTQQGAQWVASNEAHDTLTLPDKRFSFGASSDNGTSWLPSGLQLQNATAPNWYFAQFDSLTSSYPVLGTTQVALQTVDASPVPVPAAVWLFGSGLIGLATVSARRKGRS